MNDADLLLNELRVLRLQMLASAQVIENILEVASRPSDSEEKTGPCRHPIPARIPTPGMGHPNRFRCRECNEEVEGP